MKVHGKSPPPAGPPGSISSGSGYESDGTNANNNTNHTNTSNTTVHSHSHNSFGSNANNANAVNIGTNNNNNNNNAINGMNSSANGPSVLSPLTQNNTVLSSGHHSHNLSEWYVCQSAGGMPTPPSNEHSPVGHAGVLHHHHHHHHHPHLHATASY